MGPVNMANGSEKVLVSGASGMLGSALRGGLAARKTPVLQLVRRTARVAGELQWDPGAAEPFGQAGRLEALEALEGLGAAIHLSGASVAGRRWTAAYKREMAASRVGSTGALARTLAGLRKPPKALLVASATGIYGDRGDELLDESSAPGRGFLAELCEAWEAAARPAAEAGIRVVHLRFGVVVGPGEGALGKMLPLFRLGLGGRLGSGRQWMSWISLTDAVRAVLFALENRELAGAVNLTAPNPVTNAEFTRALGRAVHRPAVMPAPALALRLALGQMADEALLASAKAVPARLTGAGFRFEHPEIAPALEAAVGPS